MPMTSVIASSTNADREARRTRSVGRCAGASARPPNMIASANGSSAKLALDEVHAVVADAARRPAGSPPCTMHGAEEHQRDERREWSSDRPSTTSGAMMLRSMRANFMRAVLLRVPPPERRDKLDGKRSPRASKFGNWSKEAQAGDSSTTAPGTRSCRARRAPRRGGGKIAAARERHRRAERRREILGRLADQEGVADAREIRASALAMPPSFGQAAEDPVDRVVAGERLGGRVGVGGLAVVDVAHAVDRRDQLLAMREAGKGADGRAPTASRLDAEGARSRVSGRGVLPVMRPRQASASGADRARARAVAVSSIRCRPTT